MRHGLIAVVAIIAGLIVAATSSHAAPGTILTAPATTAEGGLVQKVQIFPRRYYRQYPYGAPPVVVVPPPRPASCGEYHYWNGQYCVDARYNRPYLGPRP